MSKGIMGTEVLLPYEIIETQLSFLKGKVLTVIDASLTDERQVKAVKDLVKNAFNEQITVIGQFCFPDVHMMTRNQVNETIGDVDTIEKEAEEIGE
jgi:predicted kinase